MSCALDAPPAIRGALYLACHRKSYRVRATGLDGRHGYRRIRYQYSTYCVLIVAATAPRRQEANPFGRITSHPLPFVFMSRPRIPPPALPRLLSTLRIR